jgi:[ribosomal protein S18]-alanine N-acetyltransferase
MTDLALDSQIAIRPMRSADLDDVVRLENEIYEFPWSLGNFKDSLSAGYSCWILHHADVILGYAIVMIGVEEAHLLNLSIAKQRQRRGLGRQLMNHLLSVVRESETRRFLLEVRQSNALAQGFYTTHGFARLGHRRGYYPAWDGREDAIVMELKL